MRFKLTLALLSCLVMFAYVSNAKQKEGQPLQQLEQERNIELTRQDLSRVQEEQWRDIPPTPNSEETLEPPMGLTSSTYPKTVENYPERPIWEGETYNSKPLENYYPEPLISSSQPYENSGVSQGNYMTLTPTNQSNTIGNPIYELQLYGNGQLIGTYQTVTGRANSQNRNRHQAGTQAPLPDGQYQVASGEVAGTHPEVGGRFLPIEPLFPTGRSALGIHYDPSFQKSNGEDGTEGCIALTNKQELDQVLQYVYKYQPQYLEVKLQV